MADPVVPTDSSTALYTVCLFLAQSGNPYLELGYDTNSAAFTSIGEKFSIPKNSVKNVRDTFDCFTDSSLKEKVVQAKTLDARRRCPTICIV